MVFTYGRDNFTVAAGNSMTFFGRIRTLEESHFGIDFLLSLRGVTENPAKSCCDASKNAMGEC
tara:strand:+ start:420 stop:608 length:189 start_codon:yes stop_codon:yes gene_type:complete